MRMTAEYVLSELSKHTDVLRGFGVKKLGLFGSVARGEAAEGSDLDFLVELERHTFDDYFGVRHFLEDLFGRPVDLVEVEAVKPGLRPYIEADLVYAEEL